MMHNTDSYEVPYVSPIAADGVDFCFRVYSKAFDDVNHKCEAVISDFVVKYMHTFIVNRNFSECKVSLTTPR